MRTATTLSLLMLLQVALCSSANAQSNSLLPVTSFYCMEDALKNPSMVYHLDLSYQELKEFPKEILLMRNLTVLDLRGNYLSELPEDLSKIENLEELRVDNNLLPVFPVGVIQLRRLKVLTLEGNGTPLQDVVETLTVKRSGAFTTHFGR